MNSSTKRLVLMLTMVVLLGGAKVYADTFDFSILGPGISASGTLTTNPQSGGSFLVTGISGMQNGLAMTLLAPVGFAFNDNLLFPSAPQLDLSGISFAAGGIDYNVYFFQNASDTISSYFECNNAVSATGCHFVSGVPAGTAVAFAATAVPEPSSLVLLATGLIGVIGLTRRRKSLTSRPGAAWL